MSVGLYLSFSRAAWLSLLLAIGVLVLLLFRIRLKSILLFIASFFILIFTFQSTLLHQLNQNEQESSDSFIEHIRSSTNISSDASNVERLNRWNSAVR
ncbi:MAG: O-antigen ligase family protein, partial [Bacteroidales bacterium]|nr:O-antigen ligase family protein [Bacteroidales bacterium]